MQTRKRTGSSVQRRKRATGDSKVDQDREAELRSLLEVYNYILKSLLAYYVPFNFMDCFVTSR